MSELTITEALAEIKTITARLEKKRDAVGTNLLRDSRIKDPLEADGGSSDFVMRERQAIRDLEERKVKIRTEIQVKNQETELTVQGISRTVADWLNWRREVSKEQKAFLLKLHHTITRNRDEATRKGMKVTDAPSGQAAEIIVHLNEKELMADIEKMELVLGELDGKLSLINATTVIDL